MIYRDAGITLNDSKKTMVESRLSRRVRELDVNGYSEYLKIIDKDSDEREHFVNSLTTNLTEFFREVPHFDYLKQTVFPEIRQKNRSKKIRVWSAASSTGEEIYSLGMSLGEAFGESFEWDFKILGTDVDSNVLKTAEGAVYKKRSVEKIPPHMLKKYFQRGQGGNVGSYRIKECLRENTKFRQFNLIKDQFNTSITFDYIFLRNVLIYFDDAMIEIAIKKMSKHLKVGGYLFIGHSESLNSITHDLKMIRSSIYKKV